MKKQTVKQRSTKVLIPGILALNRLGTLPHMFIQAFTTDSAVALFIYDRDRMSFFNYLLAELTHIKLSRIYSGCLNKAEYEHCCDLLNYLSKSPLYIDDSGPIDIKEINKRLCRLQKELSQQGIKLGLVACWMPNRKFSYQEYTVFQGGLEIISQKFDVPVFVENYKNN